MYSVIIWSSLVQSSTSSFSFASFNANVVDMPTIGRAPYCFKIQGQIYYQINEALYSSENDYPKYGQLFIVELQKAIDYRIAANAGTDRQIMYSLEKIIRQYNLFAKLYVMMKEEIEHQRELLGSDTERELQLISSLKPGMIEIGVICKEQMRLLRFLLLQPMVTFLNHMRRFTSTAPARGTRVPNRAISNSCLWY